jgi:electron transport complex protein RnfG
MNKKEEIIVESTVSNAPEAVESSEGVVSESTNNASEHEFVIFERAKEKPKKAENAEIFSFDTIRTALILLLVTGFTVILLAFINYFTKEPIAAHRKAELDLAVSKMFPETEYTQITDLTLPEGVGEMYLIHTEQNEPCGFLVIAKPMGFGGEIELMVGTDLEGTVSGVKMISDAETSTKVAPLKEEGFLGGQYASKKAPFSFVKDGGTVEAVSGSTVSSSAVLSGVNNACNAVNAYLDFLRKEQAK